MFYKYDIMIDLKVIEQKQITHFYQSFILFLSVSTGFYLRYQRSFVRCFYFVKTPDKNKKHKNNERMTITSISFFFFTRKKNPFD